MTKYKMLDGNSACVEAMKMARVKVISAYPITPQSSISEKLADLVDYGELEAKYIRVESEHTAMSCAIGAQLTGVRAATATSSVGLALMHEVLNVASGCRVPIVMPVVNRSLASPWSLWCDHQDTMAERDSGWLQIYCENVQDVYDSVIMAYKIAEDERVLTPIMVCLDGFFLSHSLQKVKVCEQSEVDKFLGEYLHKNLILNPEDPIALDDLTGSDEITEMKYQQALSFENAKFVMRDIFNEFGEKFGRKKAHVEEYKTEDAEAIIICLGSMAGTVKYIVNKLREKGKKVGLAKVRTFRPFPNEEIERIIGNCKKVAVIDRTTGFGAQGGPLWLESRNALKKDIICRNYIAGLAGRDISTATVENIFEDILNSETNVKSPIWIDCDIENAMNLREVEFYV